MSSVSSENSQGTPEPKRTDNASARMADMTEDDVVTATSEKSANAIETRSYSQDPAPSASCDMGDGRLWFELKRIPICFRVVSEHKELKILSEELQRCLQFSQAEVDDMKKENQNLKEKLQSVMRKTVSLRGRLTRWKTISGPGARFSKVPKSFRTRKAIAKSRSL